MSEKEKEVILENEDASQETDNQCEKEESSIDIDSISIDDCKEKLKEALDENDKLKNQFQRSLADYANLRIRSEKERATLIKSSNEEIMCKLLPVIDNFDRAIAAKDDDNNSIGISMIYKQLTSVLSEAGLEKVEALGSQFDPHLHDALMQEHSDDYEEGTVLEVFEPGYKFKDKLIRAAKVKVSTK
jgi:molecular chaperone GrpE